MGTEEPDTMPIRKGCFELTGNNGGLSAHWGYWLPGCGRLTLHTNAAGRGRYIPDKTNKMVGIAPPPYQLLECAGEYPT